MDQGKPAAPGPLPRPAGTLRLADVAHLAMAWSDILTVTEEKRTLAAGAPVSCGKGCAACCRELIPVSPAEAFALYRILESLPAGENASRRGRFRTASAAASACPSDPGAYFNLRIACPFLDDEACSIHSGRPLACREHLVTSPPRHCGSFPDFSIHVLALPHRVGEALLSVSAELLGRPPERIPLLAAPEWARDHAAEGRRSWDAERVADALAHHLFSR